MEHFYNYVVENYSLSGEAARMLDNIVIYANEHFNYKEDIVAFIDNILDATIGIEKQEIIDNWI